MHVTLEGCGGSQETWFIFCMSMTEIDTIVVMNNLISSKHTINKLSVIDMLLMMIMIIMMMSLAMIGWMTGLTGAHERRFRWGHWRWRRDVDGVTVNTPQSSDFPFLWKGLYERLAHIFIRLRSVCIITINFYNIQYKIKKREKLI